MVNKVAQRAIAAGLAGMMSFGAVAPAAMALDTNSWSSWWNWNDTTSDEGLKYWKRIAGADRYETMKKIVKASYNISGDYWWRASVAVVASGDNFPDALAANGLAGALNGGDGAPVILTKKGSLSSDAKELLKKMSVQTVYIMGGTAAVSAETEQAIKDMKIATVRVAGEDRQATSVEAFKLIDGNWYKQHGTHSVIIATGANFADALSIAPFAYRTGTPVVLTKADGTLTDEAVKAIKDNDEIWQVIVVGGTSAVSDSVFGVLGTYNGSYKDYYNKVYVPVRIAGTDRYDTSAKIADWEVNYALDTNTGVWDWADAGFTYYETFVATGENFPDALAGGQLAGGKWYASASKETKNYWDQFTGYAYPTKVKAASPILLTKDGNRAADSVIASNLAWNRNTVAVNAYDMYSGQFSAYLDDLLGWHILRNVWESDAHGFFTAGQLYADSDSDETMKTYLDGKGFEVQKLTKDHVVGTSTGVDTIKKGQYFIEIPDGTFSAASPYYEYNGTVILVDNNGKPIAKAGGFDSYINDDTEWTYNGVDPEAEDVKVHTQKVYDQAGAWIYGYRVEGNNFHGTILGGRAAVSKDKAKQLDDTVDGAILKINDSVGATEYDTVTINGVKYNTMSYLFNNLKNRMSVLGVDNVGTKVSISDLITAKQVIAVTKCDYRYLYQPISFTPENIEYIDGNVSKQRTIIEFAIFDRDASWAAGVVDNTYTGYGLIGYKTLEVTTDLTTPTATNTFRWLS